MLSFLIILVGFFLISQAPRLLLAPPAWIASAASRWLRAAARSAFCASGARAQAAGEGRRGMDLSTPVHTKARASLLEHGFSPCEPPLPASCLSPCLCRAFFYECMVQHVAWPPPVAFQYKCGPDHNVQKLHPPASCGSSPCRRRPELQRSAREQRPRGWRLPCAPPRPASARASISPPLQPCAAPSACASSFPASHPLTETPRPTRHRHWGAVECTFEITG